MIRTLAISVILMPACHQAPTPAKTPAPPSVTDTPMNPEALRWGNPVLKGFYEGARRIAAEKTHGQGHVGPVWTDDGTTANECWASPIAAGRTGATVDQGDVRFCLDLQGVDGDRDTVASAHYHVEWSGVPWYVSIWTTFNSTVTWASFRFIESTPKDLHTYEFSPFFLMDAGDVEVHIPASPIPPELRAAAFPRLAQYTASPALLMETCIDQIARARAEGLRKVKAHELHHPIQQEAAGLKPGDAYPHGPLTAQEENWEIGQINANADSMEATVKKAGPAWFALIHALLPPQEAAPLPAP